MKKHINAFHTLLFKTYQNRSKEEASRKKWNSFNTKSLIVKLTKETSSLLDEPTSLGIKRDIEFDLASMLDCLDQRLQDLKEAEWISATKGSDEGLFNPLDILKDVMFHSGMSSKMHVYGYSLRRAEEKMNAEFDRVYDKVDRYLERIKKH